MSSGCGPMTHMGKSSEAMLAEAHGGFRRRVRSGCLRILCLNMGENVVIEELQDDCDAVGEDKILTDVLELDGRE